MEGLPNYKQNQNRNPSNFTFILPEFNLYQRSEFEAVAGSMPKFYLEWNPRLSVVWIPLFLGIALAPLPVTRFPVLLDLTSVKTRHKITLIFSLTFIYMLYMISGDKKGIHKSLYLKKIKQLAHQ